MKTQHITTKTKDLILYPTLAIIIALSSCQKLIEIDSPKNQLSTDKVFSDTISANSALANIYSQLEKTVEPGITRNLSLYTDELDYTASTAQQTEFWQSKVSPDNSSSLNIWKGLYAVIYQCNDLLENVKANPNFPQASVQRMQSEVLFLRAFAYYYLANLYGSVPLLLSTDVNQSKSASSTQIDVIYSQIIADLGQAKTNLPSAVNANTRLRASKWSASAMLARIYLIQKDWNKAMIECNQILESGNFTPIDNISDVFKSTAKETIFQLWTQNGFLTSTASLVPANNTTLPQTTVTNMLYNGFETNDLRKTNWIGTSLVATPQGTQTYHYPFKYKNRTAGATTEYLIAIRATEILLIRAEAKANTDDPDGAKADLDKIRIRAGLTGTSAQTPDEIQEAIIEERRKELFGEWASRFIDLKRSGKLQPYMASYKATWLQRAAVLPIPQSERTYNPNLGQNDGY